MPNHDLLVLWTQLAALLLAARLLGALAQRLGQPAVAGELAAGLILGPSLFGHVWPRGFTWVFPGAGTSPTLQAFVSVSLAGLLVAIGAETDLLLIRRLGRAAGWVSTASMAVPLGAGVALALMLPRSMHGPSYEAAPFVILVAAAVAVSSLPVIAKIVSDLGLVRRNVGQLAMATGTTHDAVGFVLVALATGLVGSRSGSEAKVAFALAGVAGVSALLLTVGQRLFDVSLRVVRRNGPSVTGSLAVCVVGSLIAAAAMQAFGVEGALGAFVAGVALGRSRFQVGRALSVLRTMTSTVFAPLYFAAAGLRVDLAVLGRAPVAVWFVVLVAVAVASKFAGAVLGARIAGLPSRELAAMGVVLNGRGALQVVIATAGLSSGVLDGASYTVLILLSVVSALVVPPLLRLAMRGWEGTPEERDRLVREELMEQNVVVRGQRLLLASRGSDSSILAAEILAAAWPRESAVTVLTIGDPRRDDGPVQPILDVLGERTVDHRSLTSDQVVEGILAEANLGYGAIALGASEETTATHLLSPVLDELLMRSPLPLVIVRRARGLERRLPEAFERVVVPVSGTPSSRAGQELACNLSLSLGTRVVLVHVVTRADGPTAGGPPTDPPTAGGPRAGSVAGQPGVPHRPSRRVLVAAEGAADVVLRGAWDMAMDAGVEPEMVVRHGRAAGDEILAAASETGADLIALGTTVRHVDGHPFLGHTVEQVLTHSDATVIVVALPEQSARVGSAMAEAAGVT